MAVELVVAAVAVVVVVAAVVRILLQVLPAAGLVAAGPIVRVSVPVAPVPVPVPVAVAAVTTAAAVPADPDPGTVVAAVAVAFDLLAAGAGPAVDGQTYWYRQRPSRLIAYYPLTVLLAAAAAEAETDPVGGLEKWLSAELLSRGQTTEVGREQRQKKRARGYRRDCSRGRCSRRCSR